MTERVAPNSSAAGRAEWTALGILTLAVVLIAIDSTVLSLAIPALTQDLDPTPSQVLWIGDVYSFALAGLLITMGVVADRYGRKRVLLLGCLGFGLASVVAAFAESAEALIAARALMGVSGATLLPSTLSMIRSIFQLPAQRTLGIAIWSAGFTAGAAFGPLIGGLLLEHFWWGAVFLINVPVVLTLVVIGRVALPESRSPDPPRIELISASLSVVAIIPFVYAAKHSVIAGPDLTAAFALIIATGAGIGFWRRQRGSASPMVDLALFRVPAFSGAVAVSSISIFAFAGFIFFFSQYLQLVRGLSPLQAGLAELPSTAAAILVIGTVGLALRRVGRGPAISMALLVVAGGFALLTVACGFGGGYFWIAVALAAIGGGAGLSTTLATDAIVESVPAARAGSAASLSETVFELGIAFGVATLGTVLTVAYRLNLRLPSELPRPEADAVAESLVAAQSAARDGRVGSDVLADAQAAFTGAVQVTAVTASAITVLAGVVAWLMIPPTGRQSREIVSGPLLATDSQEEGAP